MNFKAWVTSDKDHLSKWNSCGTILDVFDSPINHSERSPNSLFFCLRRSFKQCSVAETISSWHLRCGSKICKTATLIFLKTSPRRRKTSSFTNIYTNLLGLHFCINCPTNPYSSDFQWSAKVTKVERWALQNLEHTWKTKSTKLWWKKWSGKQQPLQFIQWDFPNYQNPVLRKSCVDKRCHKQSRWIQEDWQHFLIRVDKRERSKTKSPV